MRFTVDVAGEILCGLTDLEQQLPEPAAFAGVDDDGVVIDAGAEASARSSCCAALPQSTARSGSWRQAMGRILDQLQSS